MIRSNELSTYQGNYKCKYPSIDEEVLSTPLDDVKQCSK